MGRSIFVSALMLLIVTAAASAGAVDAAKAALAAKDYASAIKLAGAALDAPDTSKADTAMLHVVRGQAHLSAKEYDAAVADFTAAADPSVEPSRICNTLGNVFLSRSSAEIALRHFRDALEDLKPAQLCEPRNAEVFFNVGLGQFGMHNEAEAIDSFSAAIGIKPDYVVAFKQRGMCYENLREGDKALADYATVLRFNPNDAMTFNNRATMYTYMRRLDDAITDYNRSIEIDPTNFLPFLNRAFLHYDKGDYALARADLDHAKALYADPKNKAELDTVIGLAWTKKLESDMADLDERLANAPPQKTP